MQAQTSQKHSPEDQLKRGKSVDNRRGRQSRNLERKMNKIDKNHIQQTSQQNTLTSLNENAFKIASNSSSGDKNTA